MYDFHITQLKHGHSEIVFFLSYPVEMINVTSMNNQFLTLLFFLFKRTMFSFLSGIYIYVIAWGLFGQDNSDTLGPQSLPDFVVSAASLIILCYDML